jgi:inositol hexakisphosphate/diphosphoinositol-pentakisphosphate kinase
LYNEKRGTFDTTKIPDIFDYITYDTIHNQKVIDYDMHPLFHKVNIFIDFTNIYYKAEIMADFIVPAEYGIEPDDKFLIGSLISEALIQKIFRDVVSISHGNSQSKTHLYFTSESHLHTLRNILLHSGVAKFHQLDEPVELHYLTHLVFKLYENLLAPPESSDR